jgi:hypothetical protein
MRGLVGTAVLVLAVASCGDLDGPQQTSRVSGTITIADITDVGVRNKEQTSSCYGRGPYLGVEERARVLIEDGSRHKVSTGRLGQGRLVYDPKDLVEQGGTDGVKPLSCTLGFVVEDVPPVGEAWSVRIGKHRFDLPPNKTSNLALSLD